MKIIISERQYGVLLEQQVRIPMPLQNPVFDKVIELNKKVFGLPVNPQITPEYTKKMDEILTKKNVGTSKRTLLGALVNFIPIYETAMDLETFIDGITTGDKAKINGGFIALIHPSFSYKAITNLLSWFEEKTLGKEQADYDENKMNELINMTQDDREKLFKRYGYGYYDKWVKAGKPKL